LEAGRGENGEVRHGDIRIGDGGTLEKVAASPDLRPRLRYTMNRNRNSNSMIYISIGILDVCTSQDKYTHGFRNIHLIYLASIFLALSGYEFPPGGYE
jgi:hypothetical protein